MRTSRLLLSGLSPLYGCLTYLPTATCCLLWPLCLVVVPGARCAGAAVKSAWERFGPQLGYDVSEQPYVSLREVLDAAPFIHLVRQQTPGPNKVRAGNGGGAGARPHLTHWCHTHTQGGQEVSFLNVAYQEAVPAHSFNTPRLYPD